MEWKMVYWHWLVFGMVLMISEIFVPSFTLLWFGLGGIIAGVALLFAPQLETIWQVLIWVVASSFFTFLWFKYFKPLMVDRTKAGLSREAIVGESGMVIKVPENGKRGVMKFSLPVLGSEEWSFLCHEEVRAGDRVWVLDVSGNDLVVEKRES